jgi:glycosyltransferase involved in cell wall biosynthesis
LGWLGTRVNLVYLEVWEDILIEVEKLGYQFQLWVMSSAPPQFKKFEKFRFIEWSDSAQKEFLSAIDIGLMPLLDNEYTVGKCGYKALQYMSHSKPIVASDVGINRDWFNGAGYVSNDPRQIIDALIALVSSKIARHQMGAQGRFIIEKKFEMALIAKKVKQVIDELS